jgi:hypothetical protein
MHKTEVQRYIPVEYTRSRTGPLLFYILHSLASTFIEGTNLVAKFIILQSQILFYSISLIIVVVIVFKDV